MAEKFEDTKGDNQKMYRRERPGVIGVVSDDSPSRTAICMRSERNTANQFRLSFLMPDYCKHSKIIRFSNP